MAIWKVMKKYIVSALIAVTLVAVLAPFFSVTASAAAASPSGKWTSYATVGFAGGSGTEKDPFVIKTAEQLAFLAKAVNLGDRRYTSAAYVLENNIDLGAHNWVPIGTHADGEDMTITLQGFQGTFDGKNHTISNMRIYKDYGYSFIGLFGQNQGTIKNLVLKDAVIKFTGSVDGWALGNGMSSETDVGGLCGYCYGVMKNCVVQNITISVSTKTALFCGGAAGVLNYSKASYIGVTGQIKAESKQMMEVGGVFGSLLNEISVSMCGFEGSLNTKSSGIITAEDVGADYYYAHYVGGFCGSAGRANSDITVKNCYAKADIVCQTDNGLQDAGLFAGGKGIVHDNGLYQNLVSSGSIKAIRKGKTKKEYAFWAGESGFANNYDASTCKNCIVLKDGTAVVTGRAYQKEPVEKTYSLEKTTLAELLCGKLGFSEKSWKINGNAFPEFSVCFLHKKAYCTSCGIKACSKHTYKTTTTKATLTKNGGTVKRCTVCGKEASKTVVYYPKTIKLSATTYNYDGKVKTPSVVVKDADGKTLKKGTDYKVTYAGGRKKVGTYKVTVTMMGKYTGSKTLTFKIQKVNISKCTVKLSDTVYTYNGKTKTPTVKVQSPDGKTLKKGTDYKVTYASGRKKVGTYKVTVKMMGKYTGSKTLTFKIIPKAASINKLTAKSKQITVKLNRSLQQSTGYEVQYSTAKTFKSAKKAVVKSYKTSSVVLSGLKAKATYYVRVRTYKTVNGVKYYSNWSNYKQIKTK